MGARKLIRAFDNMSTYSKLLAHLHETLEKLNQAGIRIPNGCRWTQYESLLQRAIKSEMSETDLSLIEEAVLECEIFRFSVDRVTSVPVVIGWERHAETAMKGQPSALEEIGNTPGRDSQSELLIAALCRGDDLAGRFAEPDLLLDGPRGTPIAVAVKRVKSESQLKARASDAGKQLKSHQIDGVAALDLAFFRRSNSAPTMKDAQEQLKAETRRFAMSRLQGDKPDLVAAGRSRRTMGLLLVTAKMAYIESTQEAAAIFSLFALPADDRPGRPMDHLVSRLAENSAAWFAGSP